MWVRKLSVFAAAAAIAAPSAALRRYEVDTTVDTTLGNCTAAPNDCGLRGAITAANNDGDDSEIILADGVYQLTIAGDPQDIANTTGDLDVNASVEILVAPGASPVIEQTVENRVFHVRGSDVRIAGPITITGGQTELLKVNSGGGIYAELGTSLELEDVVLTGNQAKIGGGCLGFDGDSLLLHRVTLTDCHSERDGGGAWLNGNQVTITSSLIEGNTSEDQGGGLYVEFINGLVIFDTTISGNLAGDQNFPFAEGGGLYMLGGNGVLRQSTVSDNQAGLPNTLRAEGGGVFLVQADSFLFENSTISGNRTDGISQSGAGIRIQQVTSTTLDHTSVVDNSTQGADGISFFDDGGDSLTLKNSIIDGGCSGSIGSIVSSGFNVERPWNGSTNTTCNLTNQSDLKVTDLMLRPLAGYGGPTDTHALLSGSPAQLLVSSAQCQSEDQRHAVRQGLFCDSGAYDDSSIPPGQWIFADGFESGDTTAWSDSVP